MLNIFMKTTKNHAKRIQMIPRYKWLLPYLSKY